MWVKRSSRAPLRLRSYVLWKKARSPGRTPDAATIRPFRCKLVKICSVPELPVACAVIRVRGAAYQHAVTKPEQSERKGLP